MMVPLPIAPVTDPDDVRLDDYRRLQDHTLRRRLEDEGHFFIVEGWEAVRRLLSSGWEVRSVLMTESKVGRLPGLPSNSGRPPVYMASRALIAEVVGFDVHRGVLASAGRPEPIEWRRIAAAASRVAVLEAINDHENLGAIFRSAAALGMDGVLMAPSVPDPLYRRSVRVSMGAVLMIPYARMELWPADLDDLKSAGFALVGLTPDPSAELIESVPRSDRIAILLGAEAGGLSPQALSAVDMRARIGQTGGLDSLNVGHAAAIAFHRLGRASD